jgi:dihydroorotate dehydrogenase
MPIIHGVVDAERAHSLAVKFAKYCFVPRSHEDHIVEGTGLQRVLETKVWGKTFSNPVGLAAGFDKDAEGILGLSRLGFGFIEVGSVTPKAQAGNDKPRVFRLPRQKGIINRSVV